MSSVLHGLWQVLGDSLRERFTGSGFEDRVFQAHAALSLAASLAAGRHALLQLPPGVGKTLIAQLVMVLSAKRQPSIKQLVICPTTLLVDQHVRASRWMWQALRIAKLDASLPGGTSSLRYLAKTSDILISTPRLLWNALTTDRLPFEFLDLVDLCFVDEYDEFTKHDDQVPRLHANFAPLFEALSRRNVKFVGLSAASPLTDPNAAFWREYLGSDICAPLGSEVDPYLPALKVYFVPIIDGRVSDEDHRISEVVSHALRSAERLLQDRLGVPVTIDLQRILPNLASLESGRLRLMWVQGPSGPIRTSVPYEVRMHLAQIRQSLHLRLKLFEDDTPTVAVSESGKLRAVLAVMSSKADTMGLIMVRYISTGSALHEHLTTCGFEPRLIHGDLDPRIREATLIQAQESDSGALLITRLLGGRGFDFPQADYAIFYSPKHDESVMWQELLRIRSSRRRTKEAYILYYAYTVEQDKAHSLVKQMAEQRNKGYQLFSPF